MDETEVQVEIACWAQDHPEASTINWDNGNEPWVDFSGQRCTLHLGLGGLTWTIEVPTGYQTEIDPGDGKRKRLWEPLDYHDTVIVQSRTTPFQVSVVYPSNNRLELFSDLGQGTANKAVGGRLYDEVQLQNIHDMFKRLQVDSTPQSLPSTASDRNREGKALTITTTSFFEALKGAETLAEVLNVIHGLAKLYNSHNESSTVPHHDAEGTLLEDEDDEHLFNGEMAIKWSTITAQVNYAREACALAALRSLRLRDLEADSDMDSSKVSNENVGGFPSCSQRTREATVHLESLTLASPPGSQSGPSASSDTDDEYTYLLPGSPVVSTDICAGPKPESIDDFASRLKDFQIETFHYDSEGDSSDGSWEIPGFHNQKPSSNQETESQDEVSWPWDPVTKKARAKSRRGPHGMPSKRIRVGLQSGWNSDVLRWCEIAFNPVSFSVECTIRLSEFMDNPKVVTALGFAIEHPLRVEVVPNKSHVDSLSWTGAVEVYVSQHTDWHNHISEEICGLLCLVPDIVQTYFHKEVPTLLRQRSEPGTTGSKGDLFVGLLQTLVRRLINVNASGSCCICGRPGDPPTTYRMRGRSLWPCTDNLCGATFATWEEVSSMDSQEREREETSQLRLTEESLRETFPYSDEDALESALGLYGVSTVHMNYGQMIRALARIELWNQKDPDTSPLPYEVFPNSGVIENLSTSTNRSQARPPRRSWADTN